MKTKKTQSKSSKLSVGQKLKESSQLYLLMLPSIIIFLIFTYYPMYGVIIAFKDFKPALGIMGSKWVGMKNFITFFKSYQFSVTIKNTIVISLYTIAVTFPLPIIMALMVNQIRSMKFKKFLQVATYLPHFISVVVMSGMIILFYHQVQESSQSWLDCLDSNFQTLWVLHLRSLIFMYGQKLGSMSVGIPSSTLQHFPQLIQAFMRQPQWMVQTSGIRLLTLTFHHWFQRQQLCLSFEWEAL